MALEEWSERSLALFVYGVSLLVVVMVTGLMAFPGTFNLEGVDVSRLPAFHATLNGTTALLLAVGFLLIRNRRVTGHRAAMVAAFTLSCVFLISYVVYHSQSPGASFGGEGWIRRVYFFILVSHIVLAPIVLPMALYSVVRAVRGELKRHRVVARWTFPVWLYVAVTGVLVYLFMAPYY